MVVVNDYKRHGIVHYPGKYRALHLWREDYHADISTYPIALYKNADGVPHLIYGEAWNHIQIMNLDTRQILTASKSLIEENAEEKHIEFYKKHSEDNKLPWPKPYDYFFSRLFLSPNQKIILSAGWVWGSHDCYTTYDIDNFISSNRISYLNIGVWEHENRGTCWINNETIAIIYNPYMEGDENSTANSPCEIHFYRKSDNMVELDTEIQISDKIILSSRMYFNRSMNSFVIFSDNQGLSVVSLDGQTLFKDENFKPNEYNTEHNLFLQVLDKSVLIYELVN